MHGGLPRPSRASDKPPGRLRRPILGAASLILATTAIGKPMRRPLDTLLRRVPYVALLVPMLLSRTAAFGADIQGVWMIEDEVAIEIAECAGDSLCGRIVWLKAPRDAAQASRNAIR